MCLIAIQRGRLLRFLLCAFLLPVCGEAQEFRAFWADTFHAVMRNPAEVSQVVADARAGNYNAIIVEVRKRGNVYYRSTIEPTAADVQAGFDPLADLVAKAHNTNNGARIEVHAWIVTYPLWNSQTQQPPEPNHPLTRYPDWLTQNSAGETWDGGNYGFDPGHPGVQDHLYRLAMECITNYDIDGFNFDYIRYTGNTWGYNPVSVARFQKLYERSDYPAPTDAQWLQFRRDQVTALLRRIYINAAAVKPHVKISADTIMFAPGVSTDAQWYSSSAPWNHVLQDWRGWMEEGILDINIPMAYFRQTTHAADYAAWIAYAKNRKFNRHVVIGPGTYLNSLSNAIYQMRLTRDRTPAGHRAEGVSNYSYWLNAMDVPFAERSRFYEALTEGLPGDTNSPLFAERAVPPVMPWKTAPTKGHLAGIVRSAEGTLDGATIWVFGSTNRTLKSDATGFFGAVDLPPGNYQVRVGGVDGYYYEDRNVTISEGVVTRIEVTLQPVPAETVSNVQTFPGTTSTVINWGTPLPATGIVAVSTNHIFSQEFQSMGPTTNHHTFITGLLPNTTYTYFIRSEAGTNIYYSNPRTFKTAGEIIIDNTSAAFQGTWTESQSGSDRYSNNYHYASSSAGNSTASALFRPMIETPGLYHVYAWYSQGNNRSTNAPYTIVSGNGNLTVRVNQTIGGGAWQLIAANRLFNRGDAGYVALSNNASGTVVIADAVRLVFAPNQDPPLSGALPLWWTQAFFGTNAQASADPDHDGYSNIAEYMAGTIPTSLGSKLDFRLQKGESDQITFFVSPVRSDRRYSVEATRALGDPFQHSLMLTNGQADLTTTGSNQFFRVRISP